MSAYRKAPTEVNMTAKPVNLDQMLADALEVARGQNPVTAIGCSVVPRVEAAVWPWQVPQSPTYTADSTGLPQLGRRGN